LVGKRKICIGGNKGCYELLPLYSNKFDQMRGRRERNKTCQNLFYIISYKPYFSGELKMFLEKLIGTNEAQHEGPCKTNTVSGDQINYYFQAI